MWPRGEGDTFKGIFKKKVKRKCWMRICNFLLIEIFIEIIVDSYSLTRCVCFQNQMMSAFQRCPLKPFFYIEKTPVA